MTHFHVDHVLGLPGMIKSFSLRGREAPLTVYGPPGLKQLFKVLEPVIGKNTYPRSGSWSSTRTRSSSATATGSPAFEVRHRIAGFGYALIEDERPGRFDEAHASELGVKPGPDFGRLHRGETVMDERRRGEAGAGGWGGAPGAQGRALR